MAESANGSGGAGATPGPALTDEELAEACRLTRNDVAQLRDIISAPKPPRGAYAKLQALKMLARYGHAVPKGEAIKPESQRPTVYVLERPAGYVPSGTPPPVGVEPEKIEAPPSVNPLTVEPTGD